MAKSSSNIALRARRSRLHAKWTRLCLALNLPSLACGLIDDDETLTSYSHNHVEKTSIGSLTDCDTKDKAKVSDLPLPLPSSTEPCRVHKALVVSRKGEYEIRDDFPVPELLGEDEVMIRTVAVGLNPIDWKSVDYNFCLPAFPWVTGREMSGIVTSTGARVTSLKVGDRVWTSTYYKDIRAGCFQSHVVVPSHTVNHIPTTLSFDEAACLGVAALAACMALWRWMQVPKPSEYEHRSLQICDEWLLIWGGSTVTGQFATQLARLSGFRVITVASQATKDVSLRMGATHVVVRDGKSDQEIVEEIRSVTGSQITRVIDLVGPKTAALALQTVSPDRPVHFAPLAMMAKDQVVPENVEVHTVEMKQFVLDSNCDVYGQTLTRLVETGDLALPKLQVMKGGLEQVVNGLEILKRGDMKGQKLVVNLSSI